MSGHRQVSAELISRVTDAVIEDVGQWRARPLDSSYPIVFLDALRVNTRQDGKSISKALYIALGIDWDGRKSVLGMWLAETEGDHVYLSFCVWVNFLLI